MTEPRGLTRLAGVGGPLVAVVGPGAAGAEVVDTARAVGRALAARGAIVVCGGRGGVMEAACRGARESDGLTVGILPGLDRTEANPYVTVPVATGLGEARNALVVRAADVLIAVAGEFGTLSEIAFALKAGKGVVGIDTWELARGGTSVDAIVRVGSAEEAVEAALRLAAGAPAREAARRAAPGGPA